MKQNNNNITSTKSCVLSYWKILEQIDEIEKIDGGDNFTTPDYKFILKEDIKDDSNIISKKEVIDSLMGWQGLAMNYALLDESLICEKTEDGELLHVFSPKRIRKTKLQGQRGIPSDIDYCYCKPFKELDSITLSHSYPALTDHCKCYGVQEGNKFYIDFALVDKRILFSEGDLRQFFHHVKKGSYHVLPSKRKNELKVGNMLLVNSTDNYIDFMNNVIEIKEIENVNSATY